MEPIEYTLNLSAPAEKAYAAVATPAGQKGWWAQESDIATEVGGDIALRFHKDGQLVPMDFKLETLEPGRKVVWRCTANANPIWVGSTLTWEITPNGGGSELRFSHAGMTAGGPPYEMTAEGWKHFMGSLKAFIETGKGEPWA